MTFYIIIGVVLFFIVMYFIGNKEQNKKSNSSIKLEKREPKKKENNSAKWEIVYRKSNRWTELGFGDGDLFPGYGKLYEREFEVWYSDVGSTEKKDVRKFNDKFPLTYTPNNSSEITGENVYLDRLEKTKGYQALFSGLDQKNRKRWYFAITNSIPTWIETEREIEKEDAENDYIPEPIDIPEGWELVRRKTKKWTELGYDNGFPGYGKVYNITFDVWYSIVGSKEKVEQPSVSVHLALYGKNENIYYFERIYDKIEGLNGKQINFERLSRSQGLLNYIMV